jgi:hypothetical protein
MQLENHKYSQGLKLTAKQNTVDLMHTCMTLLQGGIYNVQRLHHTNSYRNQLSFNSYVTKFTTLDSVTAHPDPMVVVSLLT